MDCFQQVGLHPTAEQIELFAYHLPKATLSNLIVSLSNTVKPVLSDHMKLDICLAFHTGGCLLLHESSAAELSVLL